MPAILARRLADPELGLIGIAFFDRRQPAGGGFRQILRVDDAAPARAHQVVGRVTAIVADPFVDPVEQAVRTGRPDMVRHHLGKGAKPRLARLDGLLRRHAVCQVDAVDKQSADRPLGVQNRLIAQIDIALDHRPAWLGLHVVGRDIGPVGNPGRKDLIQERGKALTCHLGQDLVHGLADQGAMAGQRLIGLVGKDEPVVGPLQQGHEGRGPFKHLVQPQPFVLQLEVGFDLVGVFDHDRDHAQLCTVNPQYRRIVQVQPRFLQPLATVQKQRLILERQRLALAKHRLDDVVIEIGDLGPALAHLGPEQVRMARAREPRIAVIVDHRANFAEQGDHRQRREHHHGHHGFDLDPPAGQGAKMGGRPVMRPDQRGHFPAARQKIRTFIAKVSVGHGLSCK